MSLTTLHHGHIRLLKKASDIGNVTIALVTDDEVYRTKGFYPVLKFEHRKEIALSIKYVDEVIAGPWLIDDTYLEEHNIDFLVHGDDNQNPVSKERLIIFPRTEGISSSLIRRENQKNSSSEPNDF